MKISKEIIEFVIEHVYKGFDWIFNQADLSIEEMGIYIQDFGQSQAAIMDVGNGQMLVINPKIFAQIEAISQQIDSSDFSIDNLEISLESQANEIPTVNCLLVDFLEMIGVEEGTHWIQGIVSDGKEISGFVEMVDATRIPIEKDDDELEIIRKFAKDKGGLEQQTLPHEINAKFWVNEYFKEKYNNESPWQEFYDSMTKIAQKKKKKKKKKFSILRAFGIK